MISEGEARGALSGDRARMLLGVWDNAWSEYVADGKARRARVRANVVWDNALNHADETFATLPGIERRENKHGVVLYVCDDAFGIHLKKTDESLRTSAVSTLARRLLEVRGTLAGMPQLPIVTFGYTLDAAGAGISNYPLVRTVGMRVEWAFDLRDIADGDANGLAPVAPILPLVPTKPDLPTIVPSRRESEEDE